MDEQQWCVADPKASVDDLQKALDWACGVGGADCSPIQPNQPCFDPSTVADHASYAFNSNWQLNKKKGGSCSFKGAAQLVSTDPNLIITSLSMALHRKVGDTPLKSKFPELFSIVADKDGLVEQFWMLDSEEG
ncbi:Glucan endo-1,3-beta-glucosidase 2 [Acorus calamus]|uniref:Glucan endo-1,3-beta-glucosidase 2 n=1 Tax=Acorus calamus TaxID=4465 RepID=A0AAV9EFJ8_ACOCL|nr:Glucan endo-1,3-beta-glucosidase 2 [Acorus calamus]